MIWSSATEKNIPIITPCWRAEQQHSKKMKKIFFYWLENNGNIQSLDWNTKNKNAIAHFYYCVRFCVWFSIHPLLLFQQCSCDFLYFFRRKSWLPFGDWIENRYVMTFTADIKISIVKFLSFLKKKVKFLRKSINS